MGVGDCFVAQHVTPQVDDGIVDLLFVGVQSNPHSVGPARGQLQMDLAARVAHHHVAQQVTQQAAVFGQPWIPTHDKLSLKFFGTFQLPWLEHRHQIVQLGQAVLDRRGGQQQNVALFQLIDQLPGHRGAIFEVMRFVYNHQVVQR